MEQDCIFCLPATLNVKVMQQTRLDRLTKPESEILFECFFLQFCKHVIAAEFSKSHIKFIKIQDRKRTVHFNGYKFKLRNKYFNIVYQGLRLQIFFHQKKIEQELTLQTLDR